MVVTTAPVVSCEEKLAFLEQEMRAGAVVIVAKLLVGEGWNLKEVLILRPRQGQEIDLEAVRGLVEQRKGLKLDEWAALIRELRNFGELDLGNETGLDRNTEWRRLASSRYVPGFADSKSYPRKLYTSHWLR